MPRQSPRQPGQAEAGEGSPGAPGLSLGTCREAPARLGEDPPPPGRVAPSVQCRRCLCHWRSHPEHLGEAMCGLWAGTPLPGPRGSLEQWCSLDRGVKWGMRKPRNLMASSPANKTCPFSAPWASLGTDRSPGLPTPSRALGEGAGATFREWAVSPGGSGGAGHVPGAWVLLCVPRTPVPVWPVSPCFIPHVFTPESRLPLPALQVHPPGVQSVPACASRWGMGNPGWWPGYHGSPTLQDGGWHSPQQSWDGLGLVPTLGQTGFTSPSSDWSSPSSWHQGLHFQP